MAASIAISADIDSVVRAAFSHDDSGRLLFGFAGYTSDPMPLDAATASPVVIQDYLMERGVKYSLPLVPNGVATTLEITEITDDRVDSVIWFTRKFLLAVGLVLADSSGDSAGG